MGILLLICTRKAVIELMAAFCVGKNGGVAMAQAWAKPFYNSKAWKACRKAYIQKRTLIDGGMCEICHKEPIYIVHHKVNLTPVNINDPDVALNHCLMEGNCKACHDRQEGHFIDSLNIPKLNCMFDESGNPVDLRKV